MSVVELVLLLLIAGVCGAVGKAIVGYFPGGFVVSIAVGFIGAMVGRWLAGVLHLPEILMIRIGPTAFPIVWAIVGAALFVALIALISGRIYQRRSYV